MKSIGEHGEKLTKKYLEDRGYEILDENFVSRFGEIDIIAVYQKILVFVEVKSRTNLNFGYPMEFVDRRKQDKIIKTAQIYIESKKFENIQCRFDVCEVYLSTEKINYIENAFIL